MENRSGIHPKGDRLLIEPEDIEKNKEGVIVIPDTVKDQHALAQSIGTLIAVGPDCWVDHVEKGSEGMVMRRIGFSEPFAKPGDRVCFAKYGGIQVRGKDSKVYRIMNDVDVTAVVEEGVDFTEFNTRKPLSQR